MSGSGRAHEEHVRVALRPVGSGLPLGFFSFGIGMLVLGCHALAFIPLEEQHTGGMILMSFVFPLELIATIFAFLARDTLELASPPGELSVTVATYLFGFSAGVLLLGLLAVLGKPFFTVLLLAAVVRQLLDAIYQLGAGNGVYRVSGGFALGLTALAMYGGVALGLEDARHRELLPLFRRGGADEAFQGFEAQLQRLESEPGVRQQL